ncbi:glycosyltransferase family 39 protein [Sulfurimonas sp. HSL1-2]|uniref:ArnT family glycosyltransferase n=1 Tax=Thiomicrolovo zhangzhouensis TaxID=3131933 RepID=UPI0031F982D0
MISLIGAQKTKSAVVLFFIVLIVLGNLIYKDYGMSTDEWRERVTATVTANYLAEKFAPSRVKEDVPALGTYKDRDYGVAFSLPAVILEYALGIKSDKDIFYLRHLLTFLMFVVGVFAVYQMSARRFESEWIGLLSALVLILSPRIFADAFYNGKDIVFMAAYALAVNTLIIYVLSPTIKNALIHAAVTAYAIDIRIMGIVVLAATIVIIAIRLFKKELVVRNILISLGLYLITASLLVVVMWPWLWTDPVGHFIEAFKNMSQFRWYGSELFFGTYIKATELPWYYVFIWVGITTPIIYLLFFIVGSGYTVFLAAVNHLKLWKNEHELQDYIFFAFFWAPVLAVIVLHSVLYNGWRQLYFIYPMFILLTTGGFILVWNRLGVLYKRILAVVLAGVLISVSGWMWKMHPMQNIYFNAFAGKDWTTKWPVDYWGLGNLAAVEYILANDKNPKVNIYVASHTNLFLFFLLKNYQDRDRINYVKSVEKANYILNNYYRNGRNDPKEVDEMSLKNFKVYYQVRDGDEVVLTVLQRKNQIKFENQ